MATTQVLNGCTHPSTETGGAINFLQHMIRCSQSHVCYLRDVTEAVELYSPKIVFEANDEVVMYLTMLACRAVTGAGNRAARGERKIPKERSEPYARPPDGRIESTVSERPPDDIIRKRQERHRMPK
ncbi:hypothetical protein Bbelb_262340 [Branchiostoma belcheri]|nr:hypothetical protein Bbelb_262340 [Branchiostoma belcheri]